MLRWISLFLGLEKEDILLKCLIEANVFKIESLQGTLVFFIVKFCQNNKKRSIPVKSLTEFFFKNNDYDQSVIFENISKDGFLVVINNEYWITDKFICRLLPLSVNNEKEDISNVVNIKTKRSPEK